MDEILETLGYLATAVAVVGTPVAAFSLFRAYVKSGMKKAGILDTHYKPLLRDNLEQCRSAVQNGNKKEAERLCQERQFMIMEANRFCRDYLTEDGSWSTLASDSVKDIIRKGFNLEKCISSNK